MNNIPFYYLNDIEIFYAGIGSRTTPNEYLELFYELGRFLALSNITLRSGAADGADSAFEAGCNSINGKKEIYIPWKGFNGSKSKLLTKPNDYHFTSIFHPTFYKLKGSQKLLLTRNAYQILGYDLEDINPSSFVVCFTRNGASGGGTGQALRIAKAYDIPIFDIGRYRDINKFIEDIMNYVFFLTQNTYYERNI